MSANLEQTGLTSEADLALQIGLSRSLLHDLRGNGEYEEGRDWVAHKKGAAWTQEGVERLLSGLGCTEPEKIADAPPEASALNHQPVSLTVLQVPKLNRKILVAKKEGGETVRVRVKDNQNFLPGMAIRARLDAGYLDVFTLEGRAPRFKGRW